MQVTRIIQALSEEERLRIKNEVPLRGKFAALFELLIRSTPIATSGELCIALSITKNNLYRMASELSNIIVDVLATAHQFPKLEFYRKRFLCASFVSELVRYERHELQSKRGPEAEAFYDYAFSSLLGFPINSMDFNLLRSLAAKWHRAKLDPPVDDELQMQLHIIFAEIGALPRNKKMTVRKMNELAQGLLDPIREKAEISENSFARYYYYQACWKASTYSNVRDPKRLRFLEQSLETIEKNPTVFPEDAANVTRRQLAYEQASHGIEIQQAFALFQSSFHGQLPDTSRNGLFLMRYIRIALMCREFDVAATLLAHTFSYPSIIQAGVYEPFLLLRANANIVRKDYTAVEEDIATARAMNLDDQFFLPHEMEIRALETTLALKKNQLEYADTLVTRNLKWMQTRRYALEQSPWPYFYQTIRARITFIQTGNKPKNSLKQHYTEFTDLYPLHAMLLETEAEELFG